MGVRTLVRNCNLETGVGEFKGGKTATGGTGGNGRHELLAAFRRPCRLNIDATPTSTVPTRMTPAEPVAAVPTDAALIAAWRGGDEPAAAELVRRHARALARFLAGAGALAADVDDLVQETFIRAFRALGRFRGQCQFRTWLMTIGGNVLKDAHRRSRRSPVVPPGGDLRATHSDPPQRAGARGTERRRAAGRRAAPRPPPGAVL